MNVKSSLADREAALLKNFSSSVPAGIALIDAVE
jgi:hypothetical protein